MKAPLASDRLDPAQIRRPQKWFTIVELSTAMADYIENFYNPAGRHSSISYLTPDECEALHVSEAFHRRIRVGRVALTCGRPRSISSAPFGIGGEPFGLIANETDVAVMPQM